MDADIPIRPPRYEYRRCHEYESGATRDDGRTDRRRSGAHDDQPTVGCQIAPIEPPVRRTVNGVFATNYQSVCISATN